MKGIKVWVSRDKIKEGCYGGALTVWNHRIGLFMEDGQWVSEVGSIGDSMRIGGSMGLRPGQIKRFTLTPAREKGGKKRA